MNWVSLAEQLGGGASDEERLVAERRQQANDAHEAWAGPMRKRWRARDDAEELYLRRASEMAAHQMLDEAGVPAGELSLNGRIAKALDLRYDRAAPASEETTRARARGRPSRRERCSASCPGGRGLWRRAACRSTWATSGCASRAARGRRASRSRSGSR